jgi:hypothetical protein
MAATDRISGRYGLIKMDPTGVGTAAAVAVASMNKWDLDLSKEKFKVTCFQDPNHIYVDGFPDIKGSYSGLYDPADGLVIFDVIFGSVKPYVELLPDSNTPLVLFGGIALLDGKIAVDGNGTVGISGSITAAGPWVIPGA